MTKAVAGIKEGLHHYKFCVAVTAVFICFIVARRRSLMIANVALVAKVAPFYSTFLDCTDKYEPINMNR